MTDEELLKRWPVLPAMYPYPEGATVEDKIALETAEIERLETMDVTEAPENVRIWWKTAISDCYWRRRRLR